MEDEYDVAVRDRAALADIGAQLCRDDQRTVGHRPEVVHACGVHAAVDGGQRGFRVRERKHIRPVDGVFVVLVVENDDIAPERHDQTVAIGAAEEAERLSGVSAATVCAASGRRHGTARREGGDDHVGILRGQVTDLDLGRRVNRQHAVCNEPICFLTARNILNRAERDIALAIVGGRHTTVE
ncbi:hypothetical protein SDC9_65802 [bioreactor metagenome]|uniref:Uncharacterized protein n=1 Tax=bioreactor metagenome TaxID=1076179 RepID=A0A644XTG0_9ZZZZ